MRYSWLLILGVCFAIYANSLHNSFHYDDEHSIQLNIHIRNLDHIPAFFTTPAMFSVDAAKGMYRPLLLVTYALNYAFNQWLELDGYDVRCYHVFNILLHGLNACLVWWLVALILGRREVALLAGLLFALHPVCTEPVNYISSRSESLAALFYLLGMGLFVKGVQSARFGLKGASWGALALGLLSKATVITLPAVLLVYDYLLVSRRSWQELKKNLLLRHGPYWLISMGYLWLITANHYLTRSLKRPPRDGWTQLLTQIEAFSYYLKLLFWPLDLNVEHQFFDQQALLEKATVGAAFLLLSILFMLFFLYRKKWDLLLFLKLWGILSLLPVAVVPLNVLVNERRLYLPCAAFCIGLALVLRSEWIRRWRLGGLDLGRLLALLALLGYGSLSVARNRVWADDFSLWRDSVAKAPLMPRVHLYLGNAYKDAAQRTPPEQQAQVRAHWRAAASAYQRTIEVGPNHELALRALNNLGSVSFVLEDFDAAEQAYKRAVELNPGYADALVNLGNISLVHGREATASVRRREFFDEGLRYFERALKISPNHAAAHGNMGLIFSDLGELEKARQAYERSLHINPGDAVVWSNLANLLVTLAQEGQKAGEPKRELLLQARQHFRHSLSINPARQEPRQGLQKVVRLLGGIR